jgi:prevent-host-death family protein
MTETVNLYDAKTNLCKLVERAAAREEIVIAKAGKPKAKLIPDQPPRKKRRFGQNLFGITHIADDFDGLSHPSCRSTSGRFVRLLIDTHILIWADQLPRLIVQPLRDDAQRNQRARGQRSE